jgi:hypothetical protein
VDATEQLKYMKKRAMWRDLYALTPETREIILTETETRNSTYTRETVLSLVAEHEEIERGISEGKAAVSSLMRGRTTFFKEKVAAAGIPKDVFLDAVAESKLSGSERTRRTEHKNRILFFLDKPVPTYQPDFFESPEDRKKGMTARLKIIDNHGYEAGKEGFDRLESNTYTPGTEEYQRFDTAWLRGAGERQKAEVPKPTKTSGRRRAAAIAEPSTDSDARRLGKEDGIHDERLHAELFSEGVEHADYELGFVDGQHEREAGIEDGILSDQSRRIPDIAATPIDSTI